MSGMFGKKSPEIKKQDTLEDEKKDEKDEKTNKTSGFFGKKSPKI